jgi:hypothetical protein
MKLGIRPEWSDLACLAASSAQPWRPFWFAPALHRWMPPLRPKDPINRWPLGFGAYDSRKPNYPAAIVLIAGW